MPKVGNAMLIPCLLSAVQPLCHTLPEERERNKTLHPQCASEKSVQVVPPQIHEPLFSNIPPTALAPGLEGVSVFQLLLGLAGFRTGTQS